DDSFGRVDFMVDAVKPVLSTRATADEMPGTAYAEVDLAHDHRVPIVERAPPSLDVLRLRHRLPDKVSRCVEQTRQGDLAVRRGGGSEAVAICGGADGHVSSPFPSVPSSSHRACRGGLPRY